MRFLSLNPVCMRFYKLTLLLLAHTTTTWAQSLRMNAYLVKALQADATRDYAVLVKGNIPFIRQFTNAHHGLFKYNIENIASIVLRGTDLQQMAQSNQVSRMEYYERRMQTLDD